MKFLRAKIAAALLAIPGLSGCAIGSSSADIASLPAGSRHVALGSSFAAGTGIGGIKPGTPERCGRSPRNYATLVSEELGLVLDDQTCGGATSAHVLGPWNELPAQIDAVNADTRLVTITIGGNDLGFVRNLYIAGCQRAVACPPVAGPAEADIARLEQGLSAIAQEVVRRAPRARLIFVQYVTLVPEQPCEALHLPPETVPVLQGIARDLASATARVAARHGAEVIPADALSRGHTACDAQPWSTGPKITGPEGNSPWHPTAAGHQAIAGAIAGLLRP